MRTLSKRTRPSRCPTLVSYGLLLVVLAGIIAPNSVLADEAPELDDSRTILFLADDAPTIIRIHIRVNQKSYRELWEKNTAELFAAIDADDDGRLDEDEAKRLPVGGMMNSPYYVRRMRRRPNRPSDSDLNRDGVIDREEFAKHLRKVDAGEVGVQTAQDQSGQSPEMDAAIFRRLDVDSDGRLSKDEFRLSTALRKLDSDDDETISLAELQPMLFSPYASASRQPQPKSDRIEDLDHMKSAKDLAIQVIDRYGDLSGTGTVTFAQLGMSDDLLAAHDKDSDSALNKEELAGFLSDPVPSSEVIVWMGDQEKGLRVAQYTGSSEPLATSEAQAAVAGAIKSFFGSFTPPRGPTTETASHVVDAANNRIEFVVQGTDPRFRMADPSQIYKQQFSNADRDNNNYLDEKESRRFGFFAGSFNEMDANGDGQLYEDELMVYVDKQGRTAKSRAVISVTDRGHNLFTTFDKNKDGRISRRELTEAAENIEKWDKDGDGEMALAEVPRNWKLSFSQGRANPFGVVFAAQPYQLMQDQQSTMLAPSWFRKMDANRDSDVSRREFLGPREDFAKLDKDGDQLISASEARAGFAATEEE